MTYFAGWDGGGTTTTIECINSYGETKLRAKAGPLNAHGNSPEQISKTIKEALKHMSSLPGGLPAFGGLCVGGAGVSGAGTRAVWESTLNSGDFRLPYKLVSDFEPALYGAFGGEPGIVLISGTGSVACGMDLAGGFHRSGGWGHIFDDEGSGYAIGRDVLAAVVRAHDGRAKPTLLTGLLFEAWDINDMPGLITRAYADETNKKEIAALSLLFQKALEQDDHAAKDILHKTASNLADLLSAVLNALDFGTDTVKTALLGGVIKTDSALYSELMNRLPAQLSICEPKTDAAGGAALMALKLFRWGSGRQAK